MSEQVNLTIEKEQPVSLTADNDIVTLAPQTPSSVQLSSTNNQNTLTVSNNISNIVSVVNQGVQVTVEPPNVVNLTTGSVQGSFNPVGNAGGSLSGQYPDPTIAATGVIAGVHPFPSSITVQADGRITSITDGVSGGTGDKNYVHNQIAPVSSVTINHNLGKYPSVTVIDTANSVVIGDITYIDTNNLTLNFSAPFSFTATLN